MENSIKVHYLLVSSILLLFFIPSFSSALCQENWQCLDWQKCSYNITERQCFDLNSCYTFNKMPKITENCSSIFSDCYNNLKDNDETDVDCGGRSCVPCSEGKTCLSDNDCIDYCIENKCSKQAIESPAPSINVASLFQSYLTFFLIFVSIVLLILLISQINKELNYYFENKFSVDLSSYLRKRVGRGDLEIEEEIDLNASIPERKEAVIRKRIERLKEQEKKEAAKFVDIDGIKVKLPKKAAKEAVKEVLAEAKKKRILKDIKSMYEYSYE